MGVIKKEGRIRPFSVIVTIEKGKRRTISTWLTEDDADKAYAAYMETTGYRTRRGPKPGYGKKKPDKSVNTETNNLLQRAW